MKSAIFIVLKILAITFFIFCFNQNCCAQNSQPNSNTNEILKNQFNESKANTLPDAIDAETKKSMESFGITSPSINEMQNFSIKNFFQFLINKSVQILKQPIFIFANCLAIILITALFENFKPNFGNAHLNGVLGIVTTLCTCAIIIAPIIKIIMSISKTIKIFQNFMLCFIPVFAGTIAMNFKTTTSLGYSSTLFFIAQFVSTIISNFLLPITSAFLAFSIVGSINSEFKINAITTTVKKIAIFILIFMITIFIGLFSIQTSIAVNTDGVAIKTAKFVSGSFIPIIGNALGEALGSVVGGLNLIKSAIGGFGILVCLSLLIPPILNIGFFIMTISITGAIAKSFKIELIDQTMTSTKDCLSLLLSFLICYGILFISTTAIIINLTSR